MSVCLHASNKLHSGQEACSDKSQCVTQAESRDTCVLCRHTQSRTKGSEGPAVADTMLSGSVKDEVVVYVCVCIYQELQCYPASKIMLYRA